MDQRSIDVFFVGLDDRIRIERNQRELACSGHGVSMAHSGASWGLEHVRCGSAAAPCGARVPPAILLSSGRLEARRPRACVRWYGSHPLAARRPVFQAREQASDAGRPPHGRPRPDDPAEASPPRSAQLASEHDRAHDRPRTSPRSCPPARAAPRMRSIISGNAVTSFSSCAATSRAYRRAFGGRPAPGRAPSWFFRGT